MQPKKLYTDYCYILIQNYAKQWYIPKESGKITLREYLQFHEWHIVCNYTSITFVMVNNNHTN